MSDKISDVEHPETDWPKVAFRAVEWIGILFALVIIGKCSLGTL